MTTPEERDLARFLLDELEMQLVEGPQPDRSWRTLGRSHSQSRLWPLRSDQPLGPSLTSDCGLTASVVRQASDDLHDESLPVTLRRSADGQGMHLAIPDLPEGWRPLCLVIATFGDWTPFEIASVADRVPQTAELAARRQRQRRPDLHEPQFVKAASRESISLAADDGTLEARSAADQTALSQTALNFTSSDLTCSYHWMEGMVGVAARLPLDEERHLGVVELSYRSGMGTVVQRRPLAFKIRVRDDWKASARLPRPESTEDGSIQIGVRPFTDQDLDLLEPAQVQQVLGSRLVTSLPLEPVADGFSFRPTMDHHRHAMSHANACWCLRVAPIGKEGDANE